MNREKQGQKGSKQKRVEYLVEEESGLLDFLLRTLSGQSRNHVKSLLTHREIQVDGKVVTQYDFSLLAGQKVCIQRGVGAGVKHQGMLDILYEDEELLVVNKPSGLLSISTDQEKEQTAYYMMTDYVRRKNPENRIFVVHRLDKDTSGVLMAAKNEKIKRALQDNWGNLVSQRAYFAVVQGSLEEKSGRLRSWLKETKTHMVYASTRAGDGKEAITNYEVIRENAKFSLLDIHLETGRKNQIRVQMQEIGHPVAGDKKYGASTNPLKRLALHAYKLELRHPFTGQVLCFETRIPKSFTDLFHAKIHEKD